MTAPLDDDELRALLDRISAERATMKPGEYPEEQPMPDADSPSPSETDELSERLLSVATNMERAFLHRIDHSGEDWRLVNPDGETAAAIMREAQSALAAMRAERDEAWNNGYAARDGVVDACRAQVLRLTEENEALRELAERLKLEAQGHASEARTANSTIYEIYQVLSGDKGEPGNWHGAEPARRYVEAAEARIKALEEDRDNKIAALRDKVALGANEEDILRFRDGYPNPAGGSKVMYRYTIEQARYRYADAVLAARTTLQKEQADG